jgi:hypothetical protein
VQPLPVRRWNAPQRKLRGKRKYFRRVIREAQAFRVDTAPDACWIEWHRHVDWRGWGNASWKLRREHLRALAIMFRHVHDTRTLIQVPFQAFIALNGDDSRYDALFLESPGTHDATFPWNPPGTEWEDGAALSQVSALLPGIRLRVGLRRWMREDDGVSVPETTYFIYSPDVGLPLE